MSWFCQEQGKTKELPNRWRCQERKSCCLGREVISSPSVEGYKHVLAPTITWGVSEGLAFGNLRLFALLTMFIKYLRCSRHCSRHWWDKTESLPARGLHPGGPKFQASRQPPLDVQSTEGTPTP